MTSDPEPQPPPRIGVALPDGELRTRLVRALRDSSVELRDVDVTLAEVLEDECFDLVVVRRSELGDLSDPDDAPAPSSAGIVVLSEGESDAQRAALVASGVAQVLDASETPEDIALSIESIADAERTGGSGGPEGRDPDAEPRLADFLSRSPYMQRFLETVRQVADANTTLLITGETGVGKERLARAIHAESPRCDAPFVALNCGALPAELLESELFGHVRGAFTGAEQDREGVFAAAHGGTIFLDEIGEMPTDLQVKLLTVLQRREVVPVGTSTLIPVDVRVLAATNRDVLDEVERGSFREDLYYRLAVITLEIPPLRDRIEDLPDLAGRLIHYFRDSLPGTPVEGISPGALRALLRHDWPGNVRELINVVERAMLLSSGPEITIEALPEGLTGGLAARGGPPLPPTGTISPERAVDLTRTLKETREAAIESAEACYLRALMRENAGRMKESAAAAGVSPRALYDRLKRYGIDRTDFAE